MITAFITTTKGTPVKVEIASPSPAGMHEITIYFADALDVGVYKTGEPALTMWAATSIGLPVMLLYAKARADMVEMTPP